MARPFFAATFAGVVLGASAASVLSEPVRAANEPSAIGGIERNLASALENTKQLLSFYRYRTNTPGYQLSWVDLATGKKHVLNYNASGRVTHSLSLPGDAAVARRNLPGACGCDIDPFTNFAGEALHVSLLADQRIDGTPTYHLRFTVTSGEIPSITDFWISRATFLPVRSKVVYRFRSPGEKAGPTMSTSDRFTWLPRTSANLAHLAG